MSATAHMLRSAVFLVLSGTVCTTVEAVIVDAFSSSSVYVGSPTVSYANVEFTADHRYMVWFESNTDGTSNGVAWHCGVDTVTGDLIPPDGKGFRAFESTVLGRANPGRDRNGVYYVGMDRSGSLRIVYPTGPFSGRVETLATPPDITRRAIYPTDLPDSDGGYVFWIKNERIPGGGGTPGNEWFELQCIDLADPTVVRVIERQYKPTRGFAPMDAAFARWFRGVPVLTYGSLDSSSYTQVRQYNAAFPSSPTVFVTDDPHNKVDPYPWVFNDRHVLMAGIDASATSYIYTRPADAVVFTVEETVFPYQTMLSSPALAQSHERIVFENQAFSVYQVNRASSSFMGTTFGQPGEIWLTTLFQTPQRQWLLAALQPEVAFSEPEPLVGRTRVWVFFNETPVAAHPLTTVWRLRRAETPLCNMPPGPPPDVYVQTVSSFSVTITWTAASDRERGAVTYAVYRDGLCIGSMTGVSFIDTGLAAETTYRYSVVAGDPEGNTSPPGREAVVVTLKEGWYTVYPQTPGDVRVSGGSAGYVRVERGDVARISFSTTRAGDVEMSVYSLQGRLIYRRTAAVSGGAHMVWTWNGTNQSGERVGSGIYTITVKGGGVDGRTRVAMVR